MPAPMPPLFAAINFFGQVIDWPDLVVVGLLILLEGLLSIDNALVLGLLAKRLPKEMRSRALSYGLIGAFAFRVLAILLAGFLLQWTIAKLIGGGYLIFIALKHLLGEQSETDDNRVVLDSEGQPQIVDATTGAQLGLERENIEIEQRVPIGASLVTEPEMQEGEASETTSESPVCNIVAHSQGAFWRTVLVIELTDIAFAVDSILAAMALAGSKPSKLWVVIVGGILGVILMRFAAAMFIKLLDRFPRFELSAYLLVTVIGLKLVLDWGCNSDWSFRQPAWINQRLGGWKVSFEEFEKGRRGLVKRYEDWLNQSWPLGMAKHDHDHEEIEDKPREVVRPLHPPEMNAAGEVDEEKEKPIQMPAHVPHLLDFHDMRRPESILFWLIMLLCFCIGFLPRRAPAAT